MTLKGSIFEKIFIFKKSLLFLPKFRISAKNFLFFIIFDSWQKILFFLIFDSWQKILYFLKKYLFLTTIFVQRFRISLLLPTKKSALDSEEFWRQYIRYESFPWKYFNNSEIKYNYFLRILGFSGPFWGSFSSWKNEIQWRSQKLIKKVSLTEQPISWAYDWSSLSPTGSYNRTFWCKIEFSLISSRRREILFSAAFSSVNSSSAWTNV